MLTTRIADYAAGVQQVGNLAKVIRSGRGQQHYRRAEREDTVADDNVD